MDLSEKAFEEVLITESISSALIQSILAIFLRSHGEYKSTDVAELIFTGVIFFIILGIIRAL
jgi:hypothetical protein